ncbi:hypothetical protein GCM10025857_37510 [Alicyclobacillus contaminans]|uniref:stage III sporulation protein AF n=1 Tax=Alicyclobacillus contaminans TaxID=392016 RepID=UPI0004150CFC|nr:stage III sporulation protein AF [Alicyclobacillus contaminans]GMA52394.1 hypothetical protein GCM10025857_37510 [Alicyclobacillus contaminans]
MTALGEWLKQLILVVLLAVFADLLLPSKSMQKYVKTVMGLAIIAVMLQPIAPLFQQNWADKVAQYMTNQVFSDSSSGVAAASASEAALRDRIQSEQHTEAIGMLQSDLQAQLRTRFSCNPETRVVVTDLTDDGDATVQVELAAADTAKGSAIRDWISSELEIPSDHVQVSVRQGGE